MIMTGTK